MLSGFKTYIGLVVALVGVIVGGLTPEQETMVSETAANVITIGGLIFAAYGRWKAAQVDDEEGV